MSSSMIHLSCARVFNQSADMPFYVGNVAPDCIDVREIKDHTHFRDRTDRDVALAELKNATDPNDSFALGVLLHLFLDMKWDDMIRNGDRFKADFFDNGVFLFLKYRGEINLASRFLFHEYSWSDKLWSDMEALPPEAYAENPNFPPDDIKNYLCYNHTFHMNTPPERECVFSLEFLEEFINNTAKEFSQWL